MRKNAHKCKPPVFDGNHEKIFILDTNILMLNPDAMNAFEDNVVIVPIVVIEEIDRIKNNSASESDKSYSARRVFREFSEMRKQGSLEKGVSLENGGVLYVLRNGYNWDDLPEGLDRSNDNIILLISLAIKKHNPLKKVILVSNDIGLYTKADACGIFAEEYKRGQAFRSIQDMYTGVSGITIFDPEAYRSLVIDVPEKESFILKHSEIPDTKTEELFPNQCCIFKPVFESIENRTNQKQLALFKGFDEEGNFLFVKKGYTNPYGCNGIVPRNDKQALALALMLDHTIDVVSIEGIAGTGKTLMAMLAGFMQKKRYPQIRVFRAAVEADETLGFAPGTREEKFLPWKLPITDVMTDILGGEFSASDEEIHQKGFVSPVREHLNKEWVTIEPYNHVRGRTFKKCFIVIDEAQNLTREALLLVITRAGEGSKVVFVYDQTQIDRKNLSDLSNGPAHLVAGYQGQYNFGHIVLTVSERSFMAEQAVKLLCKR